MHIGMYANCLLFSLDFN